MNIWTYTLFFKMDSNKARQKNIALLGHLFNGIALKEKKTIITQEIDLTRIFHVDGYNLQQFQIFF